MIARKATARMIARAQAVWMKRRGKKKMKSEIKKACPQKSRKEWSRERARGEPDVVERHRSKVLMIRKGRKWEEDLGVTNWLQMEVGEDVEVEVEKTKKWIWCEGEGTKKAIWEARRKWEEEEIATVEEWKSIAERRTRARAIEEMKRTARRAGYKDARIIIKEQRWDRKTEVNEEARKD